MKRYDLKIKLAKEMNVSYREADKIILSLMGAIHKGIKDDGKVIIMGFGCFRAKDMPAKKIHNPHTREYHIAPPIRKVSFKAGKELAELVNNESS